MKERITEFVNSIEGFGNLIVTKPDGTTKKHKFKNTITKHFRQNLINAILYGDQETVFDDNGNELPNSNPEGYYWSNKLIAYQFKVTVGQANSLALVNDAMKSKVINGFTSTIDWDETTYTGKPFLGESRYNVIGNVDTQQAQLIEGFTPQEIRMGKEFNPNSGQWTSFNSQEAFDFEQNVFVGYTTVSGTSGGIIPGLKQPQFKPARENLRLDDAGEIIPTINIDKYSNVVKSWFDWDVMDSQPYGGTQSILRQSMGAGTWVTTAYKTDDEEMISKYDLGNGFDSNGQGWLAGLGVVSSTDIEPAASPLPEERQYSSDSGSGKRLVRGSITSDFYAGQTGFDGEDSTKFYSIDYDLYIPEERWYWSFGDKRSENTENWSISNPDKVWIARDVEKHKLGYILAIEVQNFPSKLMYGGDAESGTTSVDPETLAFHCPAITSESNNTIEIDRNDNLTVEYNFKFTEPTTGDNITWNGMYLDELSRAINPVKDTEQVTNSANKIQMTGAVIYEDGVFESTEDSPTEDQLGHSVKSVIENEGQAAVEYTTKRVVPNTIKKKTSRWNQPDVTITSSSGNVSSHGNTTVAGSDVRRKTTDGKNSSNAGTLNDYDADGKLTTEFARIWVSSYADLFTVENGLHDFTNDNITSDTYDHPNSFGAGVGRSGQPMNYTIEAERVWRDARSFYAQTNHTRMWNSGNDFKLDNAFDYFQYMVSLLFDHEDGRIDFSNNRCQIFISPYGNISNAIVRHAKLTKWLNDFAVNCRVDGYGNVYKTSTTKGEPVINIETIWQNGLRLFGDGLQGDLNQAETQLEQDGILKLHDYSDDAVKTLKFKQESTAASYMIPSVDTNESISVIKVQATSDSRFVTTPKFFTVNYGSQFGHPVPGDMHDEKIESMWTLKDDWMKELDKITLAGGFNSPNSVDWSQYYQVEDRDLIPQVNTSQLEHYLGQNDPTGFGERGYLTKDDSVTDPIYADNKKVFPELNWGMAVLYNETTTTTDDDNNTITINHKVKDEASSMLEKTPVADFTGNVSHSIIYGGQLYSHMDGGGVSAGDILWDFRLNPVVVLGYTNENSMSLEEPTNEWTQLTHPGYMINVVSNAEGTVEAEAQYTVDDAKAAFAEYNGGSDFDPQIGDTVVVEGRLRYSYGHTNNNTQEIKTLVADSVASATTWPTVSGSADIKLADAKLYQFVSSDDGLVPEVSDVGSTVRRGKVIVGTSYKDMGGKDPQNRWQYGDQFVFVAGDAPVILELGGQTENSIGSPQSHDNIVGTSIDDNHTTPNTPQHGSWSLGDKFELSEWSIEDYDQFLGQQFTCRDMETTTVWDLTEINYPERTVTNTGSGGGESTITSSTEDRFLSSQLSNYLTSESAYVTYNDSKNKDNYKKLMVRIKQLVGARGLKEVSLKDYISRTIDFDPEIYENKTLTDTGIMYSYIRQGSEPVLNATTGIYSSTDEVLGGFGIALQNGYRETAPFRIAFHDDDTADGTGNYDYLDLASFGNDIISHVGSYEHPKSTDLVLNRSSRYGRFGLEVKGDGVYAWEGPTTTPFGMFTANADNEDEWGINNEAHYGVNGTNMESNFPVFQCWAERMHPSVNYEWNTDNSNLVMTGKFPIPASFRLNAQINRPLSSTTDIYNDGSTNISVAENLMDEINKVGKIPFPSIDNMVTLVKTIENTVQLSIKIADTTNTTTTPAEYTLADAKRLFFNHDFRKTVSDTLVDNAVGDTVAVDHYFKSDEQLMQFVTSIAPHGFKEFYDYDNATPEQMRLSLPHPNQHMFYGLIDIGDSSTGGAAIGSSGPTWTPGDQVQMTWTVRPPASGSGGAEEQNQ